MKVFELGSVDLEQESIETIAEGVAAHFGIPKRSLSSLIISAHRSDPGRLMVEYEKKETLKERIAGSWGIHNPVSHQAIFIPSNI